MSKESSRAERFEYRFRLVVLGAGFAKAAGLPLANELLLAVIEEAKRIGHSDVLEEDLEKYCRFRSAIEGREVSTADVDIESFITYLDIEHFLELRGSDTWAYEGNQSQILIRNLISKVLFEKQNCVSKEAWRLYDDFASRLTADDIVVSFNYDTFLETCLRRQRKNFRYALNRIDEKGFVDQNSAETVLLKMHGSINWFDVSSFDKGAEYFRKGMYFQMPDHPVFGNHRRFNPQRVMGLGYSNLPGQVYQISDMQKYFDCCQYGTFAPMILSPSHAKKDSLHESSSRFLAWLQCSGLHELRNGDHRFLL